METDIILSVVEARSKHSIPEYSETVYGGNSIVSYGADNDMPILLRNCYRDSATLHSIIDGYIPYILGSDIEINSKIASFSKQVNPTGLTMRQFIAALALDYMIYGGFCFQIVYSQLGTKHSFYPLDFSKARTNESGTKIFYSKRAWTKYGTKSTEYPRYTPEFRGPSAIYYYKGDYTKGVYPSPTWMGALNDVLTEVECSRYSLNTVSNGFSAKFIINLPNSANLTKEQKDLINEEIKNRFTGSETDSNFMLYFAGGDKEIKVSKVESDDTAERFTNIKENCRSNIYTALRCSPLLMGLPAQNGFSTTEYRDVLKIFNTCVIKPIQDTFTEVIDKVFAAELNGEHGIEIIPFKIDFEDE